MAPRDNDDSDKPKKSWREIDKARDGARSRSGSGEKAAPPKPAQYSRYKSAADKFFSGDPLPDSLKEKLDPTGEGQARREALRRLKDADDVRQFAQVAEEYVGRYGLPEDPYLLDRLLSHPNEDIVTRTLERLAEMHEAGELTPPKSLVQRLKSLELTSDSPDVQDAAAALARKLR